MGIGTRGPHKVCFGLIAAVGDVRFSGTEQASDVIWRRATERSAHQLKSSQGSSAL
jgi:hypothetical protein